MNRVEFGDQTINFTIERSPKRKTVSIVVDPERGVVAKSPTNVDDEQISRIVIKKAPWILEKKKVISRVPTRHRSKEFVSGESLQYLGRNYRLKVLRTDDGGSTKLVGRWFIVEIPEGLNVGVEPDYTRDLVEDWYIDHARERIMERVEYYAQKLDVEPKDIIIKEQSKRWGSCTSRGVVSFNWRVIMAPMSIVDYVVVHELCHLNSPNHSEEYWQAFATVIPDYNERRNWLKTHGATLSID